MNFLLHHLYSGQLFFSAVTLLLAIVVLDLSKLLDEKPVAQSVARVGGLLAIALAALSGTPTPVWLATTGGSLAIAHVAIGIGSSSRRRIFSGTLVVVAALTAVAIELPFHLESAELSRPARIIVVGDSLSSGGFGEREAWPVVLGSRVGIDVVNLSRAGDTVAAAISGQLPDIPVQRPGDLVIVEVGGNDMLGGVAVADYSAALEELSVSVSAGSSPVAMFELPVLPGRWRFGAAQRRIAREYGITLVPKRVLSGVLLEPDNTYDGLHLTQSGHDALAAAVAASSGW